LGQSGTVTARHAAFEPDLLRLALESKRPPAPADVILVLDRARAFQAAIGFEPGADFRAEGLEIGHRWAPLLIERLNRVVTTFQARISDNFQIPDAVASTAKLLTEH
jgi:hypothetical protein